MSASAESGAAFVAGAGATRPAEPPPLATVREPAVHGPVAANEPTGFLMHALDRAVERVAGQAKLSRRERSVLRFVAMGYCHPEIGAELGISPRTVKMHAAGVRHKTGTQTRADLMKLLLAA
ncbi:MAG: helix-turn-helix transcriptional regulator [Myxococcota bacterium]